MKIKGKKSKNKKATKSLFYFLGNCSRNFRRQWGTAPNPAVPQGKAPLHFLRKTA